WRNSAATAAPTRTSGHGVPVTATRPRGNQHKEIAYSVIPREQPDGADIGIAAPVRDKHSGGEKVHDEPERCENTHGLGAGHLMNKGTVNGIRQDAQPKNGEEPALQHGSSSAPCR